jgi:uncharacterized protein YtpQ (UPF0354 family)
MKVVYYSLLAMLSCLTFSQCSKETSTVNSSPYDKSFSDSALAFLQHTLSYQDYGNLDLASIRVLKNKDQVIAFRIAEKASNDQKFVLLRKTTNKFEGNKVDFSGLNTSLPKNYNGDIILRTLGNSLLKTITVKNNKAVMATDPSQRVTIFQQTQQLNRTNDTISAQTLDEVFVIGTSPVPPPDYASMYWLFNQYSSYENVYYSLCIQHFNIFKGPVV